MFIQADSRAIPLADQSVHCCVTSPPYWGLRDYNTEGQLGLEPTPEEYVANMVEVFREVKRVLRDDGTLWLNLGDSYAGSWGAQGRDGQMADRSIISARQIESHPRWGKNTGSVKERFVGYKPKDLCGIPWLVAKALQSPYYTGRIRSVEDRIWLAAMIDAEGCIFIHKRGEGLSNGQGYVRKNATYGSGLEVSNVSTAIVERCREITGLGSICQQSPSQNHRRKQTIHRWNLRSNVCREVLREVYPYLVAKQHEARLAIGCPSSGPDAAKAHESLKRVHNGYGAEIDFPSPASMFEQGWYLRSDIIWAKKNCMPESVTDRPTKAHEYLFLLSKRPRYYYDAEAIREPVNGGAHGGYVHGNQIERPTKASLTQHGGKASSALGTTWDSERGRNRRSVWEIATQPFAQAHFATFPEKLIEPCILAGCPEGGRVLDPFVGSGTTVAVSRRLGRHGIGLDVSAEYLRMAVKRGRVTQGMNFQ